MGGQLIEGKGVSRTNGFAVPASMLTVIGIDTPHRSQAEHPLYDRRVHLPMDQGGHADVGDDHPHVLSMKEFGVQQPVLIEVHEIGGKDVYIVAEGRGRVIKQRIADKLLKKEGREGKPVPCTARRANANIAKLDRSLMIVLNEHRTDDSVMNRAQKAQYLLATGDTIETVAQLFGKSTQTIQDWIKLCELPEAAQAAVDNGAISASAAVKLHGLPKEDMKRSLDAMTADGGKVTVKKATALAKGTKTGVKADGLVTPSKRAIKRAIADGTEVLSEDFIRGLRVAIGDLDPKSVKGLMALLNGGEAAE